MAIETFGFIDDLNAANPTATDNVSEGDDHLRGLKTTLKNTFPNVTGAINATETELNYVDGVTSAIQTQLDAKADTDTTYTASTGLTLTGTAFSVQPDLRDGITHVGRDTSDYIQIDTATIRFYINGVNVMSCDASGNIIAKGNVTAYGTPS